MSHVATRATQSALDSRDIQDRLSYIYSSETLAVDPADNMDYKYDSKGATQYSERAGTVDSDDGFDHITDFPNKWAEIRYQLREPMAEFLGTMIMLIFGTGVTCQVTLSGNTSVSPSPKGEYLSISFGWAIGVALSVWVSSGISGGHVNPAVTLVRAIFRGFPWRKVPCYILAQTLGACAGAGVVYANYYRAIDIFEGSPGVRTVPGTAALFTTFAVPYLSNLQCFFSEVLGAAVLLVVALAATDKRNSPPPKGLVPLVLFLTVLGEGAALGMQTGYVLNPARDFGPRLMCWLVGYDREVWNYRSQYWLWAPVLGSTVGAILGAIVYDGFLYTGSESIFNRPTAFARRRRTNSLEVKVKGISLGMNAV